MILAAAALAVYLALGAAAPLVAPASGAAAPLQSPGRDAPSPARMDPCRVYTCDQGAVVRGDASVRRLALVFTGGSFADGGEHIRAVLRKRNVRASFFFTGDFYRTPEFAGLIRGLAADGHYLGPHSNKHLLYCDWNDRGRTLVTREAFRADLEANFREMARFGIARDRAPYFIPPYEWSNAEVAGWVREMGLVLFDYSPGTSSNADYTTPSTKEYLSSREIYDRILAYEEKDPHGLNGFLLLLHIGTDPERTDKLYLRLDDLVAELGRRGYAFVRLDELLKLE